MDQFNMSYTHNMHHFTCEAIVSKLGRFSSMQDFQEKICCTHLSDYKFNKFHKDTRVLSFPARLKYSHLRDLSPVNIYEIYHHSIKICRTVNSDIFSNHNINPGSVLQEQQPRSPNLKLLQIFVIFTSIQLIPAQKCKPTICRKHNISTVPVHKEYFQKHVKMKWIKFDYF